MDGIIIPILGICCGLLAIFGGVYVKPWIAYRQRKLELTDKIISKVCICRSENDINYERIYILLH